jgi:hypothetical protein
MLIYNTVVIICTGRIIIPDLYTAHEEKRGEVWQAVVGQRLQQGCGSGGG